MHTSTFPVLLEKYLTDSITPAELQELYALMEREENQALLGVIIEARLNDGGYTAEENSALKALSFQKLETKINAYEARQTAVNTGAAVHRIHFLRRKWWVAAAILLLVTSGWWWWQSRPADELVKPQAERFRNDVAPGSNGAVLTLGNGQTIVLDSARDGNIAQDGNANIRREGTTLAYHTITEKPTSIATNTLTTPKGKRFSITLPDGSMAWLNAQSSITFPTAFTGDKRIVNITGEVYFEVASRYLPNSNRDFGGAGKRKMPFIVHFSSPTGGGREGSVEVLGTHFNINAYEDEKAVSTTLLEGSVKVMSDQWQQSVILTPGEQAIAVPHSPLAINHSPDLQQVMAWKDGLFYFDNADLRTIMRQVSRWYNIEVEFAADAPSFGFNAKMPATLSLSELLKLLELTKLVHFEIDGQKITVSK